MTTNGSEQAREQARAADGRFGEQSRDESTSTVLTTALLDADGNPTREPKSEHLHPRKAEAVRMGERVWLEPGIATVTSADGDHKSVTIEFDYDADTIASYDLDEHLLVIDEDHFRLTSAESLARNPGRRPAEDFENEFAPLRDGDGFVLGASQVPGGTPANRVWTVVLSDEKGWYDHSLRPGPDPLGLGEERLYYVVSALPWTDADISYEWN